MFNLVDDAPAPKAEAASFARELLRAGAPDADPPPPREPTAALVARVAAAGDAAARGKRVRNARLAGELGYALRWPTYREGLRRTFAIEHAHGLVVPDALEALGAEGGGL